MRAFSKQRRGVEEAVEVEAAAGGVERSHLFCALMLRVNPGKIGRGLQRQHPGTAERTEGARGEIVAQARPLQRGGACFGEGRRNLRG